MLLRIFLRCLLVFDFGINLIQMLSLDFPENFNSLYISFRAYH